MKQKLIPIISVIIGILAAYLSHQFIAKKQQKIDKEWQSLLAKQEKVLIVAAWVNIPRGTIISQKDVRQKSEYTVALPSDIVYIKDAKRIVGRKITTSLKPGDPIRWSHIEGGAPESQQLSSLIREKMRAVSISVSGADAVSGLIKPDNKIDILGTFSFPSESVIGEMETVTLTMLQDVTVLATGQTLAKQRTGNRSSRASSGYSTITVQVTPREAEVLVFAQQMKGRITATLRNSQDNTYMPDLPKIDFKHIETKLPELNKIRQTTIRSRSWKKK